MANNIRNSNIQSHKNSIVISQSLDKNNLFNKMINECFINNKEVPQQNQNQLELLNIIIVCIVDKKVNQGEKIDIIIMKFNHIEFKIINKEIKEDEVLNNKKRKDLRCNLVIPLKSSFQISIYLS